MKRALLFATLLGCGVDLPPAGTPDMAPASCPPRHAPTGKIGCVADDECRSHKSGSMCAGGICCIALRPDQDGGMP